MWTRRDVLASLLTRVGSGSIGACGGFCATQETIFERALISDGDNRPSLDMRSDRLTEICVALHRRKPLASIGSDLGISSAELRGRIDSLVTEGLVRRSRSGQFLPTFMVITLEDAKWMAPPVKMVEATGRLIVKKLPRIRARAESIPAIRRAGFSQSAFLLLSDVLLDNWQIEHVESGFLHADRPLRNGRRYYYAILEKPAAQQHEPFGIFGNGQFRLQNIQLGFYGNRRCGALLYLQREEFARLFEFPAHADIKAEVAALLQHIIAFARMGGDHLSVREKAGLGKLGLFENGKLRVTIFTAAEVQELGEVAALLTADLLDLLQRHRADLESAHERSPYREEASFNDFFIWWYHFYYSATTEWLAHNGLLEVPRSGNVTYLIAD